MKVRRCVVSGCSGCVVMGLIDRRRRSRNGDVHLGKGGVVAFELGSYSVVQPNGCFRFGSRFAYTWLYRAHSLSSFTLYKAGFQPGVTDILYQNKLSAVRCARVSTSCVGDV